MPRRWGITASSSLVLLVAATSAQATGASGARCAKALPQAPAGLPAPIVVTTRCGRFRLEPGGAVVYKGPRTSPVPRGASYWPQDLVWYRFARHHLLIGRGLRELWRSHDRYPVTWPANLGRVAVGRLGLSFSYFRRLDREPRLYLARYGGPEHLAARGEDPLAFVASGELVTWRDKDHALVLRGRGGRFERVVNARATEPQWDPGARLLVFRIGCRLRVFDGRRVRELAWLRSLGVTGAPVVEPLGQLVAVHDTRRLVVLDYDGRVLASARLPSHQTSDGVSSSAAANPAATKVAFTATDRSRGEETVYVLAAGARRLDAVYSRKADFRGCGWSSSVAWHRQWLLYSDGDERAAVVGSTGSTGAIDLSNVVARLPGFERDGLFEIAWAPAP